MEIRSEFEKIPARTPITWAANTEPTSEEWADWFIEQSRDYQVWWHEWASKRIDAAQACIMQDHSGLKEDVRGLREVNAHLRRELDTCLRVYHN